MTDEQKHKLWIEERLAKERAERQGRIHMWDLIVDELGHLNRADIVLEQNPLDLGPMGMSYLEQVQILFPEVGPGYGDSMRQAIHNLIHLLPFMARDRLTDEERIEIGWSDNPYKEKAA